MKNRFQRYFKTKATFVNKADRGLSSKNIRSIRVIRVQKNLRNLRVLEAPFYLRNLRVAQRLKTSVQSE